MKPIRIFAATGDAVAQIDTLDGHTLVTELNLEGRGVTSVAVDPRDPDRVFAGTFDRGIYRTRDGGENWRRQPTGTEVPIFGFISGEHGLYAVGDNATVLSLNGSRWQSLPTPEQPLYLRAGQLLPNQQLLVAGGRGLLLNLELPKALAASTD